MKRDRRYPPKGWMPAGRYIDKATGDLVLLYQDPDPGVVVRVPKSELDDPDCLKRKRRKKVA